MKVTKIEESGNNQVLLWAIKSNAQIATDNELISIINSDLFYHITLEDVNFFELFRLTQQYRDKLRIIRELPAAIPDQDRLKLLFDGSIMVEDKTIPAADACHECIEMFMNLAMQMYADDDAIIKSSAQMFLPMISRKFTVQIPYNFSDLVFSINPENGHAKIFNENYPNTLNEIETIDPKLMSVITLNLLGLVQPIKHSKRFMNLLNATKFYPLKSKNTNSSILGLIGFRKYNNITRGEVGCNLFKIDQEAYDRQISIMKNLKTPLLVDFAVRIPIQLMQLLQNRFDDTVLPIKFESSVTQIIQDGLTVNNWGSYKPEEEGDRLQFEQNLSLYQTRISQSEMALMNLVNLLAQGDPMDVDQSSMIALLPSIYTTRAIVTYDCSKAELYKTPENDLNTLFDLMGSNATSIQRLFA